MDGLLERIRSKSIEPVQNYPVCWSLYYLQSVPLVLATLLQIAGLSMICLAAIHPLLAKLFNWSTDLGKLTQINRQIFIVHTIFLVIGILMLGIVCVFYSGALIAKSTLALVANASFTMCWLSRLICQFFIFTRDMTGNVKLDNVLWFTSTLLWIYYTGLFGALFLYQLGFWGN
jgi:hypothetical protein